MADENRLQILAMLRKGERCVCEIWKALRLPQNLVSHHLRVLKDAGLIKAKKVGLNVHYSIDRPRAKTAVRMFNRLIYPPPSSKPLP